jgi:hypothetical protein
MKQLTTKVRKSQIGKGDVLMEELKPLFSALSNNLDLNLLQKTHHFGSGNDGSPGTVSQDALKAVAEQGQVESFCLVQPMPSNKFTSVNIYLDEVGLLKRLPLNKRAGAMALKAGFNPAPKFYGDVFIGRLKVSLVLDENEASSILIFCAARWKGRQWFSLRYRTWATNTRTLTNIEPFIYIRVNLC